MVETAKRIVFDNVMFVISQYERWSRGAMSTFLDTKRDGTNVEQERIDENYL